MKRPRGCWRCCPCCSPGPQWSGTELAERLGVTTRTIRNDIERLRDLGYPVNAERGVHGNYRLGAGAALPPLLLEDDEAIAVVLGLRAASTSSIERVAESSAIALAKLEQVLPSRLRRQVNTLSPGHDPGRRRRRHQRCRSHSRSRDADRRRGGDPRRRVAPLRLRRRAAARRALPPGQLGAPLVPPRP